MAKGNEARNARKAEHSTTTWLPRILAKHQRGELDQAAREYRDLLQIAPDCADAHHLLGLCLLDLNQYCAALECLRQAVRLADHIAEFHADVAAAAAALGNWQAAAAALQSARTRGLASADRLHAWGLAQLRQSHPMLAAQCFELECQFVPRAPAYHNWAVALLQLDRLTEAERALTSAIERQPDFHSAYRNRALLLERMSRMQEALCDWMAASELCPSDIQLRINIARVQAALGLQTESIQTLNSAIKDFPADPVAWNALGTAWQQAGDHERAVECLKRTCELLPESAEAHANVGSEFVRMKQFEEALKCYDTACGLDPGNALLHRRRATCLSAIRRWQEAESAARAALALEPDNPDTLVQLGMIIGHSGDIESAVPHLQKAVDLKEGNYPIGLAKLGLASKRIGDVETAKAAFGRLYEIEGTAESRYLHAISLPVIYQDMDDLVQRRMQLEADIDSMLADGLRLNAVKTVMNSTFLVAYQGYNDRVLQEKIAKLWHVDQQFEPRNSVAGSNRLRVGFLSSLLKYHTVGKLTRGWIKELDRRHCEVSVISFYDHEDSGAEWIRSAADHYVSLSHDLAVAAQTIVDQRLDVLIYPEIGMDPLTMALARLRLAPVQCVMWGHPVTTGLPSIDYFLSSQLVEPAGAADHYCESLFAFSTLPTFYYRPRLPDRSKQRSDFGISDDAHVYLCPHSLFKMHPQFDTLLGAILDEDPQACLVLIEGRYQLWNQKLVERFRRTIGKAGQRVHFLPSQAHTDYLRLLEVSDVLLDAPHFGGGNTHYEAFSVGLPVVTKPSSFMRGRVALGLYQRMNIEDAIAESDSEYVEKAVRLASNKRAAAALREKILSRNAQIYDDHQSVRELESFLLEVTHRSSTAPPAISRLVTQKVVQPTVQPLCRQLRSCTCPACGHHVAVDFFNPGHLPLATLAWPADAAEALVMKRLPHDFVRCVECGHVYNTAFQYGDVPYSTKPNLMFNRGALWQEHLQKVRDILLQDLPGRPTVVEIGCGEGHLLRALAGARPDATCIGFDPNASVDTGGKFQARTELFDPAIHLEQCRPDLLISRHVLEHLMNPNGFIQALAFAVSCTGRATRLFIEVPCIDHVFELGRTVDFFYEHHSHFTTVSLERMLRRSATDVQLVATSYNGEVAYALAEFRPREHHVQFAGEAQRFHGRAQQNRDQIRRQLDELYRSGRRVAIWGGTGKAAAFIQQLGIDRRRFPLVVDSDADKAGTYVPGSGQRIEFRDCLRNDPADVIIIATQWRAADIVLEIMRCGIRFQTILIEHGGRLVDYFRDEHPYHAPHVNVRAPSPAIMPAPHVVIESFARG